MVSDRRPVSLGTPSALVGRPAALLRAALETLLWMLRNGGGWQDSPDASPWESTCRRRLKDWTEAGLLTEVWSRLADEFGEVDWEQLIADGTFCRAKKDSMKAAVIVVADWRDRLTRLLLEVIL